MVDLWLQNTSAPKEQLPLINWIKLYFGALVEAKQTKKPADPKDKKEQGSAKKTKLGTKDTANVKKAAKDKKLRQDLKDLKKKADKVSDFPDIKDVIDKAVGVDTIYTEVLNQLGVRPLLMELIACMINAVGWDEEARKNFCKGIIEKTIVGLIANAANEITKIFKPESAGGFIPDDIMNGFTNALDNIPKSVDANFKVKQQRNEIKKFLDQLDKFLDIGKLCEDITELAAKLPQTLVGPGGLNRAKADWQGFKSDHKFPETPTIGLPKGFKFDDFGKDFSREINNGIRAGALQALKQGVVGILQLIVEKCEEALEDANKESGPSGGADINDMLKDTIDSDVAPIPLPDHQKLTARKAAAKALQRVPQDKVDEISKDFLTDVSASLTAKALCNLLEGEPTRKTLEVIKQIVLTQPKYKAFNPAMLNNATIITYFKEIGESISPGICQEYVEEEEAITLLNQKTSINETDFLSDLKLCLPEDDPGTIDESILDDPDEELTLGEKNQIAEYLEDLDNIRKLGEFFASDPDEMLNDLMPPILCSPGNPNGIIPPIGPVVAEQINKTVDLTIDNIKTNFSEEGQAFLKGFRDVEYKPSVITLPKFDDDGDPTGEFELRKIQQPIVTIYDNLNAGYTDPQTIKPVVGNENYFNFGELLELDQLYGEIYYQGFGIRFTKKNKVEYVKETKKFETPAGADLGFLPPKLQKLLNKGMPVIDTKDLTSRVVSYFLPPASEVTKADEFNVRIESTIVNSETKEINGIEYPSEPSIEQAVKMDNTYSNDLNSEVKTAITSLISPLHASDFDFDYDEYIDLIEKPIVMYGTELLEDTDVLAGLNEKGILFDGLDFFNDDGTVSESMKELADSLPETIKLFLNEPTQDFLNPVDPDAGGDLFGDLGVDTLLEPNAEGYSADADTSILQEIVGEYSDKKDDENFKFYMAKEAELSKYITLLQGIIIFIIKNYPDSYIDEDGNLYPLDEDGKPDPVLMGDEDLGPEPNLANEDGVLLLEVQSLLQQKLDEWNAMQNDAAFLLEKYKQLMLEIANVAPDTDSYTALVQQSEEIKEKFYVILSSNTEDPKGIYPRPADVFSKLASRYWISVFDSSAVTDYFNDADNSWIRTFAKKHYIEITESLIEEMFRQFSISQFFDKDIMATVPVTPPTLETIRGDLCEPNIEFGESVLMLDTIKEGFRDGFDKLLCEKELNTAIEDSIKDLLATALTRLMIAEQALQAIFVFGLFDAKDIFQSQIYLDYIVADIEETSKTHNIDFFTAYVKKYRKTLTDNIKSYKSISERLEKLNMAKQHLDNQNLENAILVVSDLAVYRGKSLYLAKSKINQLIQQSNDRLIDFTFINPFTKQPIESVPSSDAEVIKIFISKEIENIADKLSDIVDSQTSVEDFIIGTLMRPSNNDIKNVYNYENLLTKEFIDNMPKISDSPHYDSLLSLVSAGSLYNASVKNYSDFVEYVEAIQGKVTQFSQKDFEKFSNQGTNKLIPYGQSWWNLKEVAESNRRYYAENNVLDLNAMPALIQGATAAGNLKVSDTSFTEFGLVHKLSSKMHLQPYFHITKTEKFPTKEFIENIGAVPISQELPPEYLNAKEDYEKFLLFQEKAINEAPFGCLFNPEIEGYYNIGRAQYLMSIFSVEDSDLHIPIERFLTYFKFHYGLRIVSTEPLANDLVIKKDLDSFYEDFDQNQEESFQPGYYATAQESLESIIRPHNKTQQGSYFSSLIESPEKNGWDPNNPSLTEEEKSLFFANAKKEKSYRIREIVQEERNKNLGISGLPGPAPPNKETIPVLGERIIYETPLVDVREEVPAFIMALVAKDMSDRWADNWLKDQKGFQQKQTAEKEYKIYEDNKVFVNLVQENPINDIFGGVEGTTKAGLYQPTETDFNGPLIQLLVNRETQIFDNLITKMKNSQEFKILFDYIFPIDRFLALSAIYTSECARIDKGDHFSNGFNKTKEMIISAYMAFEQGNKDFRYKDPSVQSDGGSVGKLKKSLESAGQNSGVEGNDAQRLFEHMMSIFKAVAMMSDPAVGTGHTTFEMTNAMLPEDSKMPGQVAHGFSILAGMVLGGGLFPMLTPVGWAYTATGWTPEAWKSADKAQKLKEKRKKQKQLNKSLEEALACRYPPMPPPTNLEKQQQIKQKIDELFEKSQSAAGLTINETILLAALQSGDFSSFGIGNQKVGDNPLPGYAIQGDKNAFLFDLLGDEAVPKGGPNQTGGYVPSDDSAISESDIEALKGEGGLVPKIQKAVAKMGPNEGVLASEPIVISQSDESEDEDPEFTGSAFTQGNPFFEDDL